MLRLPLALERKWAAIARPCSDLISQSTCLHAAVLMRCNCPLSVCLCWVARANDNSHETLMHLLRAIAVTAAWSLPPASRSEAALVKIQKLSSNAVAILFGQSFVDQKC